MNMIQNLFALVTIVITSTVAAAAEHAPEVTVIANPAAATGGEAVVARCGADGTIHLVFQSHKIPHYAKSTDGGKTWSRPVSIVDRDSQKPGLEFDAWDMAVGKG